MDSLTKEPFPMELVGVFWVVDLIFKGCYGDSLLYSNAELCWGIQLPAYQGEIPVLPAPSYWQARQPEATKQSPTRTATPNPSVESPRTIRSSGKGSPHRGLGYSSNISTPKCPDSTSAKKPSSSKEPTSNGQEKSPKAHSSRKCGRSPSPSAEPVRCKWKDVCTRHPHTQPSPSAPVPLMASTVQWDPTAM